MGGNAWLPAVLIEKLKRRECWWGKLLFRVHSDSFPTYEDNSMRERISYTVTATTATVASFVSATVDSEASLKFMAENPNIPQHDKNRMLSDVATNKVRNAERAKFLRGLLKLASEKLSDESTIAFFQLPGVIEEVVEAANDGKEETREKVKSSNIQRSVKALAKTLDSAMSHLPAEVRAEMLEAHKKTLDHLAR